MNPFIAGKMPKNLPESIKQYGEYVVITSWKNDDEFSEIVGKCVRELLRAKEKTKELRGIIELQSSMEIVVQSWPKKEPIGYSIAMRFLGEKMEEGQRANPELEGGGSSRLWVCDKCHTTITKKDKRCPGCGLEIVWG